ncbi:MAG: chorismate synthase [Firmicutes bacterium]|nr:chorismate synthase [Bacillota bacterium]
MRFLTAGESHGPVLTAIIEGLPAGLPVTEQYINTELARRQGGYGRGGRMQIERDRVTILSGVRGGYTLGSPVTLQVENRDWKNWQHIMGSGTDADLTGRRVSRPRPGHADLAGGIKYRQRDMRNILERSSARETAVRVAVGTIARRLLEELGITVMGAVVRIGSVETKWPDLEVRKIKDILAASQVLCPDPASEVLMKEEIDRTRESGDSLGGIFEIHTYGLPAGLGSHVHWDRKLDGLLAGALMGIQAIKGVEVGAGFNAATLPGSLVHDEIFYGTEKGFYRETNRAGGIEGGISNGEAIVVRAAMKPIPTLYKPLSSVDIETKEPFQASVERSDVCAVPAACVVGEAVTAQVLASICLEKFGGDHLEEIRERVTSHRNYQIEF